MERDSWKGVALILVIVALVCGGYVWFRFYKASQFPLSLRDSTGVTTPSGVFSFFRGQPPMICKADSGGFDGARSMTLYIFGDSLRTDTLYSAGPPVHILLDATGMRVWGDDTSYFGWILGPNDPLPAENAVSLAVFERSSCSPWWFPDRSLFQAPDAVSFKKPSTY